MTTTASGNERFEELLKLIVSRRTIYDFKPDHSADGSPEYDKSGNYGPDSERPEDDRPSPELIRRAMEAACWAPNHKHTHPWRFYMLGAKARARIVSRYRELVAEKRGKETARVKSARWAAIPGWMVVTSKRSRNPVLDREDYGATCCMVQNLSLLLWAAGIGMKWSTGPVTEDPVFLEITGIDPEEESIVGLFGYGYPAEIPVGKRPDFTDFVKVIE